MKKIETTSLWLMINEIIIAIQRGWDLNFDDVEMVQYTEAGENGTTATRDGRFDHIEIDNEVAKVWCIAGTGHENFSFPIGQLSEDSVKDLHDCIRISDMLRLYPDTGRINRQRRHADTVIRDANRSAHKEPDRPVDARSGVPAAVRGLTIVGDDGDFIFLTV